MPWASSTCGWVAQSLHAMQWVRFVASGASEGNASTKSVFWVV